MNKRHIDTPKNRRTFWFPIALTTGFCVLIIGCALLSLWSSPEDSADVVESISSADGKFVATREWEKAEDTELVYVARADADQSAREMCIAVLGPQDDDWRIEWVGDVLTIATPKCISLRFSTNTVVIDGKVITIRLRAGEQLVESQKPKRS